MNAVSRTTRIVGIIPMTEADVLDFVDCKPLGKKIVFGILAGEECFIGCSEQKPRDCAGDCDSDKYADSELLGVLVHSNTSTN